LSIPSLKSYLQLILDLRKEFGGLNQVEFEIAPEPTDEEKAHGIVHKKYKQKKFQRIFFDIPLLNYPNWFDIKNATTELIEVVEECVLFMEQHEQNETYGKTLEGFKPHEVLKLKRNLSMMREGFSTDQINTNRRQFYQFIQQYDTRRKTDFLETFPEMRPYWSECEKING
jgi:hypothetical protein